MSLRARNNGWPWLLEPICRDALNSKWEMEMATKKSAQSSTKGLEDLFYEALKDIYYAERKILSALKKMARGAESQELTAAFEKHRDETEGQVERL
jgi:hypothetical protein